MYLYEKKMNIPKWLVANCNSILSLERMNGGAITPALLLPNNKQNSFTFDIPNIYN